MWQENERKKILLGILKLVMQKIQKKVFQKYDWWSDIQKVFEESKKLVILEIYLKSQEIGQQVNESFTNYKH